MTCLLWSTIVADQAVIMQASPKRKTHLILNNFFTSSALANEKTIVPVILQLEVVALPSQIGLEYWSIGQYAAHCSASSYITSSASYGVPDNEKDWVGTPFILTL